MVESTTVDSWMKQSVIISSWSLDKPNIYAVVDSAMAVLTRGASRILVDLIAVDLQLKQVEFICCSFTIETKELECSWSLVILLQVQPGMKWNGWCVCHAKSVAWTNRVISPGFIMWATVLWLFGCLASLDGPLVTNSLFSRTCLITISSWALLEPSIPSRVEREETLNTPLWGGDGSQTSLRKERVCYKRTI